MKPDTSIPDPLGDPEITAETPSEIVVICQIERIDIDTGEVTGGSTIAAVKA